MFLEVYPRAFGDSTVRRCSKCAEVKPVGEFPRIYSSTRRVSNRCKDCVAKKDQAYYRANKTRFAEYQREYKQSNRERIAARDREYFERKREERSQYAKEYRATHKNERAAYLREWRSANKERALEQAREYRATNAERIRQNRRIYDENNPHIRIAEKHRRRAREAECPGTFTAEDAKSLRAGQTDNLGRLHCWWCGKTIEGTPHLDHKIALAVGGTNDPGNLCYACPTCNMRKQSKSPAEFAGRLF